MESRYIRECTLSLKEGAQRVLQIFQKIPGRPEDHRDKWSSYFFKKYFIAPSINFSLALSVDYRSISMWIIFTEIFKILKSVNIHKNIQTVTFTNNT